MGGPGLIAAAIPAARILEQYEAAEDVKEWARAKNNARRWLEAYDGEEDPRVSGDL